MRALSAHFKGLCRGLSPSCLTKNLCYTNPTAGCQLLEFFDDMHEFLLMNLTILHMWSLRFRVRTGGCKFLSNPFPPPKPLLQPGLVDHRNPLPKSQKPKPIQLDLQSNQEGAVMPKAKRKQFRPWRVFWFRACRVKGWFWCNPKP